MYIYWFATAVEFYISTGYRHIFVSDILTCGEVSRYPSVTVYVLQRCITCIYLGIQQLRQLNNRFGIFASTVIFHVDVVECPSQCYHDFCVNCTENV